MTLASINGQLQNLSRAVMATREDMVALRGEVRHVEKTVTEIRKRQDQNDNSVRELEDFKLIHTVQWDGPKRVIAFAAGVGVLITVVGGIISILNGLGLIG